MEDGWIKGETVVGTFALPISQFVQKYLPTGVITPIRRGVSEEKETACAEA